MAPFNYDTLDHTQNQIRLIRVLRPSANESESVRCTISTFDCDSCPEYSALSYTWGSPNPEFEIRLDGHAFMVRDNLYQFLLSAVHCEALSINYLFVDQICIDQSSPTEKSRLVQRMSEIFAEAKQVIAWLGAGCSPEPAVWQIHRSPSSWGTVKDEQDVIRWDCSEEMKWFKTVCSQLYWTRLWIVQELFRAKQFCLVFGGRILTHEQVRELVRLVGWPFISFVAIAEVFFVTGNFEKNYTTCRWALEVLTEVTLHRLDAVLCVESDFSQHLVTDLSSVLSRFALLNCEDPRDKVYGLLGIMHPEARPRVDYSMSSAQVYWSAIALCQDYQVEYYAKEFFKLGQAMHVTGTADEGVTPKALEKFHVKFPRISPTELFAFKSWETYADSEYYPQHDYW